MSKFKDLTGQKFNSFTVIKLSHINHSAFWVCKCNCGVEIIIKGSLLIRATKPQKSCMQCYEKRRAKHGATGTKEFFAWRGIKSRCDDPNSKAYKDYGGRGITYCERWKDFNNFLEDMGYAPTKKHSIDRIENDKGYYKENCRWAIQKTQARNTRRNKLVEFRGEIKCLSEWAEILNTRYMLLFHRLNRGMDVETAFTIPAGELFEKISFNGKSQTILEWAKETGLDKMLIRRRLRSGWKIEDVLSTKKYIKPKV